MSSEDDFSKMIADLERKTLSKTQIPATKPPQTSIQIPQFNDSKYYTPIQKELPVAIKPIFESDLISILDTSAGRQLLIELNSHCPEFFFAPGLMYRMKGPLKIDILKLNIEGIFKSLTTGNPDLPYVRLTNTEKRGYFTTEVITDPIVELDLELTGPLVIHDNRLIGYRGAIKCEMHKNEISQLWDNVENGLYQLKLSGSGKVYLRTNTYYPVLETIDEQDIWDADVILARSPSLKYSIDFAIKGGAWFQNRNAKAGEGLVHILKGNGIVIIEANKPESYSKGFVNQPG